MDFGILDSIPDLSTYKSYTERYFTKRYITNVNGIKNNDIMIMFHSNRIALLCLAPSHHFFQNKEEFTINFNVGKVDRRDNAVKGKGKKGGQVLSPKSVVCKVEYKDGASFEVPCCMKGKLIEVNEELLKEPNLLRDEPDAAGFIAVILSTIEKSDLTKQEMLTPEDYSKSLNDDGGDGDVLTTIENSDLTKQEILTPEDYSKSLYDDGGDGDVLTTIENSDLTKQEMLTPEVNLKSLNDDNGDVSK